MITFTTEKLYECIKELKELIKLHYDEVAPYSDIPLNVNWERLILMDLRDSMKCFIVRKDDKLVGYANFFISSSIEYQGSIQAKMSNIFIHPDHRGHGIRFISYCDEQLKKEGVQVVYHHVKARNDYGVLLNRLGYDIMNIEYSKRLDKD